MDTLIELGATVHLAHPLGVKGFAYRRVKNDERDAADLADLLRMGRLPEAWIAPPADPRAARAGAPPGQAGRVAHQPEVLRCTPCWPGPGSPVTSSDLFGPGGRELLERVALPTAMRAKVNSAVRLIDAIDFEIDTFARLVTGRLRDHPGYAAVQTIPGVGPTLGAVFVAEIGPFTGSTGPSSWPAGRG